MAREKNQILQTLASVLESNVHQNREEIVKNSVQRNKKHSNRGLHLTRMLYSAAKIQRYWNPFQMFLDHWALNSLEDWQGFTFEEISS